MFYACIHVYTVHTNILKLTLAFMEGSYFPLLDPSCAGVASSSLLPCVQLVQNVTAAKLLTAAHNGGVRIKTEAILLFVFYLLFCSLCFFIGLSYSVV